MNDIVPSVFPHLSKTFVCICYICVREHENVAFQTCPVPLGDDLQGPSCDPVIGCSCCSVGLITANSHVSSGQPPPEHCATLPAQRHSHALVCTGPLYFGLVLK